MKQAIAQAKGYDDIEKRVGPWTGEQEFAQIVEAIEARNGERQPKVEDDEPAASEMTATTVNVPETATVEAAKDAEQENSPAVSDTAESATLSTVSSQDMYDLKTPVRCHSPDPALLRAPLGPANESRMPVPALVSGEDIPTPTPSQTA